LAPMVVSEFHRMAPGCIIVADGVTTIDRSLLPATGPVCYCETNGLPWSPNEYRRKWRLVANEAGVPKSVTNMDSRAGGITEATEAGADIEHVKHAATHSDISQTQRYSRGATEKIAQVQAKRNEHRFRRSG
jgi:site-specific recombinase XerD